MCELNEISYTRLLPEQYSAVLDFLFEDFVPRESIYVGSGQNDDIADQRQRDTPVYRSWMEEGISIIALDTSNSQVAGVCLNYTCKPDSLPEHQQWPDMSLARIANVLHGEAMCADEGNMFEKYSVDRVFELSFLGVGAAYGRRGIASCLVAHSMQLAKELGYKLAASIATSPYSCKAMVKNGFIVKKEIKHRDIVVPGGALLLPSATVEEKAQFLVWHLTVEEESFLK